MINQFLTFVGSLAAVHLICTATFLKPRAPVSVVTEVAVGFACAVGVVASSVAGDTSHLLLFCSGLLLCLVLFSVEKTLRKESLYVREPDNIFTLQSSSFGALYSPKKPKEVQ